MAPAAPRGARAERTRATLLRAAEALFAERGFAATRLEDVAECVGIRRASIVYHFRDKQELYDAVLADVFGGLLERVAPALECDAPLAERVEAAVGAWVDYVGERPSLARILLREIADGAPGRQPAVRRQTRPFFELVERLSRPAPGKRARAQELSDTIHFASTIAGATVFFLAAMPALIPELHFDPLRPTHLAEHRERVLDLARHLLRLQRPRA